MVVGVCTSCSAIIGIGDPMTDPAAAAAGDWPKTATSKAGPTTWTPVYYTDRSAENTPTGPTVTLSDTQKANLLSQLPAEMDTCKPCPSGNPGFLLRVFDGGTFADRLETCDALANCLGEVLKDKSFVDPPPREILLKFLPR